MLEVGLIVNPVAGIGGPAAQKGSDAPEAQAAARQAGSVPRGTQRARRALQTAGPVAQQCRWWCLKGEMGGDCLDSLGLPYESLGVTPASPGREDTIAAAHALRERGVDLIVFSGGDGTARDLHEALGDSVPVLGIPAGVKMHSGVFTTTPERAGELLVRLFEGRLVNAVRREVRDLDEDALRRGELRPHFYGELLVPEAGGYLQHTKERGRENEALAVQEIVAYIIERIQETRTPVVLGPGSTLAAIKSALGFDGTLLGFDVWVEGAVLALDVDSNWLEANLRTAAVVLSFTRGQGFLLGRGNQQLSPTFLRRIRRASLLVVGTRTKLDSLEGRPLLLDTDDPELDRELSGLVEVIAGYEDHLFYRLAAHA